MPLHEEKSSDPMLTDTEIRTTVNYWNQVLNSKCRKREFGCVGEVIIRELLDGDDEPAPEFFNFLGAEAVVIENPDKVEPNTSANVIEVFNSVGGEFDFFAGIKYTLSEPLDFSGCSNKISMLVYTPKTNITIRLKLEANGDQESSIESDVEYTGPINQWTKITFDFGGSSLIEYNCLVFFFDLGLKVGDTYYNFDAVQQESIA